MADTSKNAEGFFMEREKYHSFHVFRFLIFIFGLEMEIWGFFYFLNFYLTGLDYRCNI